MTGTWIAVIVATTALLLVAGVRSLHRRRVERRSTMDHYRQAAQELNRSNRRKPRRRGGNPATFAAGSSFAEDAGLGYESGSNYDSSGGGFDGGGGGCGSGSN